MFGLFLFARSNGHAIKVGIRQVDISSLNWSRRNRNYMSFGCVIPFFWNLDCVIIITFLYCETFLHGASLVELALANLGKF